MAGGIGNDEDIFDAGAAPEPGPGGDPESLQPDLQPVPRTPEDRALSDAIRQGQREAPTGRQVEPTGQRPGPGPQQPQGTPQDQQPQDQNGLLLALLAEREQRQRYQRELDQYRRQQPQQPQPGQQQPPPKPIDVRLFEEPEAVINELQEQIYAQRVKPLEERMAQMAVQTDMALASVRHQDVWGEAWNAWTQQVGNPDNPDPVSYFAVMNAPSPGEALVAWYKDNKVRTEVGGDLNAFRERIRAELMAEMGLAAPQGQQPQAPQPRQQAQADTPRLPDGRFAPRQQVRLPTPVGRMGASPGGNTAELDGSDEAIFESARPKPRRG